MHWLEAVARLRERREPGVLVTVTSVHGHAPRAAGAKMVVAAPGGQLVTWGSIGGGNLEATALDRARGNGGLQRCTNGIHQHTVAQTADPITAAQW